jgi:hypothetical protein
MSNHEKGQQYEQIKKLPEGSKAEMIRNGVEERLTEITTAISEGRPSLARLELQKVGQRILALFDEILGELPENMENEHETVTRSVSSEDLAQGGALIGDNRSKRFWEIDSEIGQLMKNFDELYKKQATEPEVQTEGFVINPDQPSLN